MSGDPVTIGERYLRATRTKNLVTDLEHRCDSDLLLAAGMAAARDPRFAVALAAFRLRQAGETVGLHSLVESTNEWLQNRLSRGGHRVMTRTAREALLVQTLRWWLNPTCPFCEGRCFETIEEAGRLDAVECSACHGTGLTPLARSVPHAHVEHAYYIVDRLDAHVVAAHVVMTRILSARPSA